MDIKNLIESGNAILGIEFGSTRIKAVLIGENNEPIAQGAHDWENDYVDGIWTYSMDKIHNGMQDCYASLCKDVKEKYGAEITNLKALGFSAMMHGYLAFDKDGKLLVPFRTWRNTITAEASEELTKLFNFHIPQRWSIAHLYQAVLNGEEHVKDVAHFTTLAGYIHWQLTGEKVLGVGEASGMFPIEMASGQFDKGMIAKFDEVVAKKGMPWKLEDLLPSVVSAGASAGTLTEAGAKLLDASGKLSAGIPLCPPEGDAGTGMVATNSVAARTGNVSAGTSAFGMLVLEKDLSKPYDEIDMVTTPDGFPVAMAHCNNCTSDINAWVSLLKEFADLIGANVDIGDVYVKLFNKAMEADKDCGGLLAYNYLSGEHITAMESGRPLFVRTANSNFNLANFMRTHIMSSLSVVKTGMDILLKEEKAKVDKIYGHGGLFKTKGVGQSILAAAMDAPVYVMETAGEGGAWGIALLASYLVNKNENEKLPEFLERAVFAGAEGEKVDPDAEAVKGFEEYIERYTKGLAIERAAVDNLAE